MKRLLLVLGILLLLATEILRVYFIMPFPGSQHRNTIALAYFIDRNRIWLRIAGFFLIGYAWLIHPDKKRNRYAPTRKKTVWPAIVISVLVLFYAVVFYLFNFRFEADKMFEQPRTVTFAGAAANKVPLDRLVIGVVINNEAKAYPIGIIGYHHQIRDSIGNTPVMITYCTVCRTGRAYSPIVKGRPEQFRLVGMDHFNAMFEDAATNSWWQQATGLAVAGPLQGMQLAEIPSAQYTLAGWLRAYPNTKILQPDSAYADQYADLADYDNGSIKGSLEHRDSASWKTKSWVIGVRAGHAEKAYDWNDLVSHRLIHDSIGSVPVLLYFSADSNFHAWNRVVGGQILRFTRAAGQPGLQDINTSSSWNVNGLCISGTLKGQQLQPLPSYQEFWHSWSHFHPTTTRYNP
ncbi:MAG TPA: DUF3179 domain-containing (seleno)protein [Puia sp.]|jgi:hypothetical protein|nr:DUF3179 domain-containing (seleno)protein [Puia sp.]